MSEVALLWAMTMCPHGASAGEMPKKLAYSATPNSYFNERAAKVARIYDGFFFVIGTWDDGVAANLGVGPDAAPTTDWRQRVGENLAHLNRAGVTENLLGVCFGNGAPWPSPETLLSKGYTEKFRRHFGVIGKAARGLGFRGVSIDVEYPYPRYSLDHPIYTYDGYTAENLLAAATEQGRAAMSALLAEFPEAVVFLLPGDIWGRPIERAFVLSMLRVMAERDALGGFHLGYERSYGLLDPVSQVAIPRVGDCMVRLLADPKTLDYWKRRCTVAPGVWPLHMVETGGKDYPVRPWREELTELRQQLAILRSVAKRYIWSFSGQPVWYVPTPDIEQEYRLGKPAFEGAEEAIRGWHRILSEKKPAEDPRIKRLVDSVHEFDAGRIDAERLCGRLGTPCDWQFLGPLGNPFTHPRYSAPGAVVGAIRPDVPIQGRDDAVRWFVFRNCDPVGSVRLRAALDWRNTDDCSAHLVAVMSSPEEHRGCLCLGWDDGIAVWFDDRIVFDRRTYPKRGHGMLFKDRFLFEERVPVVIPKGRTRLNVTSINSHGVWGFSLRFTDSDGFPFEDLTFSTAPVVASVPRR
jgi:hypothetical protein